MELSLRMSAKNPLLNATSTNDFRTLHSLLNDQDRQLFSQIAKNGTPETAAYLLSRHSVPEDYSRDVISSNPTVNPIQYLACRSASSGNAALFRYLSNQYPSLLSTWNHNIEDILVNAIEGGVDIWKIILDHDPHWKDHEFGAHKDYVLERVVEYEEKELLEFLLKEGADTDREGAPVLEEARLRGADSETLELIKKYSE